MTKELGDDFNYKVAKWMDLEEDEGAIHAMFDKIGDPPNAMMFRHKIDGEKVKIVLLRTPKDNTVNDLVIVISDDRDLCKVGYFLNRNSHL